MVDVARLSVGLVTALYGIILVLFFWRDRRGGRVKVRTPDDDEFKEIGGGSGVLGRLFDDFAEAVFPRYVDGYDPRTALLIRLSKILTVISLIVEMLQFGVLTFASSAVVSGTDSQVEDADVWIIVNSLAFVLPQHYEKYAWLGWSLFYTCVALVVLVWRCCVSLNSDAAVLRRYMYEEDEHFSTMESLKDSSSSHGDFPSDDSLSPIRRISISYEADDLVEPAAAPRSPVLSPVSLTSPIPSVHNNRSPSASPAPTTGWLAENSSSARSYRNHSKSDGALEPLLLSYEEPSPLASVSLLSPTAPAVSNRNTRATTTTCVSGVTSPIDILPKPRGDGSLHHFGKSPPVPIPSTAITALKKGIVRGIVDQSLVENDGIGTIHSCRSSTTPSIISSPSQAILAGVDTRGGQMMPAVESYGLEIRDVQPRHIAPLPACKADKFYRHLPGEIVRSGASKTPRTPRFEQMLRVDSADLPVDDGIVGSFGRSTSGRSSGRSSGNVIFRPPDSSLLSPSKSGGVVMAKAPPMAPFAALEDPQQLDEWRKMDEVRRQSRYTSGLVWILLSSLLDLPLIPLIRSCYAMIEIEWCPGDADERRDADTGYLANVVGSSALFVISMFVFFAVKVTPCPPPDALPFIVRVHPLFSTILVATKFLLCSVMFTLGPFLFGRPVVMMILLMFIWVCNYKWHPYHGPGSEMFNSAQSAIIMSSFFFAVSAAASDFFVYSNNKYVAWVLMVYVSLPLSTVMFVCAFVFNMRGRAKIVGKARWTFDIREAYRVCILEQCWRGKGNEGRYRWFNIPAQRSQALKSAAVSMINEYKAIGGRFFMTDRPRLSTLSRQSSHPGQRVNANYNDFDHDWYSECLRSEFVVETDLEEELGRAFVQVLTDEAWRIRESVISFDFSGLNLGPAAVRGLAAQLPLFQMLETVVVDKHLISIPPLRSLSAVQVDWSGHNLSSASCIIIAKCLENKTFLNAIDMSYNAIGDEGVAALSRCLAPQRSEHKIVRLLNLESNSIGPHGTRILSSLLYNVHVSAIILDSNMIGTLGSAALADALRVTLSLEVLSLSGNRIGVGGAFALSEGLRRNTSLRHLDLRRNDIRVDGARALIDALQFNRRLKLLDIRENGPGFARNLRIPQWESHRILADMTIRGSASSGNSVTPRSPTSSRSPVLSSRSAVSPRSGPSSARRR